jgi:phosphoglycolate phosphatase
MENTNKPRQLVLWDVDGTLLDTRWTDKIAMSEAGLAMTGKKFSIEGVDMAGTLDPNIWRDIAHANGVADAAALEANYRRAYLKRLRAREVVTPMISALPGALELLARLSGIDGVTQGVLSGNYPEIGLCKLRCAGIDSMLFRIFAWGPDGRTRRELFPAAFGQYQEAVSQPISPGQTVVIGDTPRDIECARAFGCRMLAVATGKFSEKELADAGADLVVPDLADTKRLVDWILSRIQQAPRL